MKKSSVNKTHAAFFVKNYKFKPICRYLLYFYSTQQNNIATEIKLLKHSNIKQLKSGVCRTKPTKYGWVGMVLAEI
jgi:hypothetical protein